MTRTLSLSDNPRTLYGTTTAMFALRCFFAVLAME